VDDQNAGEGPFRAIFESALDAILILDDDRRYVDANPAACTLFGLDYDALLGSRLDQFIAPDLVSVLGERWGLFLDRGTGKGEMQIVRDDGTRRDVELTSRANFVPGRHLSILRDITEQKIAEEALQASEERFYMAFSANPQPMFIALVDDGTCLEVNDSFLEVTGYEESELLGHPGVARRVWTRAADWSAILAGVGGRATVRDVETEIRAKDGSTHEVLVAAERIELDGEQCVLVAATDITGRKRLEAQLRQSQRLESVGRLAGGIAHDFNNLLTVISGYSELALRRVPEGSPIRRDIEEVRRAGERASALTRQLLAYSRRQLMRPKILDLNVAVAEMSKMLVRLIGEDVELSVRLDPALGRVEADPGQIEQVIANLAVNARDAMVGGGHLTIETSNVDLGDAFARTHAGAPRGPHVMLAVADTGAGMNEETAARIFEPFFTTKEPGEGTGLGLATVYGIVTQSGGTIDVTTEPGLGSTFRVYLPCVPEAASETADPAVSDAPHGDETVLVVEDQDEVRALVAEALSEYGYRVIQAQDGECAVALCEARRDRIDLIVTDVVMPRMSGRQLAERLAVARPETKVLFMSGYTESAVAQHGVLDAGIAFLPKPFTPDDLARKVREVLDA
jgi:two-component system cell cycle sensor histidine kinase/response regulator CckA